MRKFWAVLLALPLLVGCRNVIEQPLQGMMIVEPKAPQPGPADHAYALAYADRVRADWVADLIAQNQVRLGEMTAIRDDYLNKAGAYEVDVFGWPPRTQAGNLLYSSWAAGVQEDMNEGRWLIQSLDYSRYQLLNQAFEAEYTGRKVEAGSVPYPYR